MSYHPRFDERVSLDGGLYGLGSYFTESTCKANQYTELDGNSERCMVYCRVLMGAEPHRTRATYVGERRPPDNPRTPGATFDSTFAESGVANSGGQIHNEFVVFRGGQAYPEFVVWYTAPPRTS
jgi:hypothetical protein